MRLLKALKPRVAFPSEEATLKMMNLALRNVIRKWEHLIRWKPALNCFTLLWEDAPAQRLECSPGFFAPDHIPIRPAAAAGKAL